MMLEKIPEELLSRYYHWIAECYNFETLETLKDWILDETEYLVKAAEAIKGLKLNKKKFSTHLGLNKRSDHSKGHLSCSYCKNEGHEIGRCQKFQELSVDDRWKAAKEQMLCFRCLSNTHRGVTCRQAKECGINGCKVNHHRLLHATRDRGNASSQTDSSSRRLVPVEEVLSVSSDGGQVSSTMEGGDRVFNSWLTLQLYRENTVQS